MKRAKSQTPGEAWAALLADFERGKPSEAQRKAFGSEAHQCSHLPTVERVRRLRARFIEGKPQTIHAFRCPLELWPHVAAALSKPWPREAVLLDLRWWTTTGLVPGRAPLQTRWGWGQDATRAILRSTDWHDRSLPPPVRGKWRSHLTRGQKTALLRGGATRSSVARAGGVARDKS